MHISTQSKISGTVVIHTKLVYIVYLPDEEINEFLKVYLDTLKGFDMVHVTWIWKVSQENSIYSRFISFFVSFGWKIYKNSLDLGQGPQEGLKPSSPFPINDFFSEYIRMDCMGELIWSFIIGVHANLKNCKNISNIPIQLTAGTATAMLVTSSSWWHLWDPCLSPTYFVSNIDVARSDYPMNKDQCKECEPILIECIGSCENSACLSTCNRDYALCLENCL